MNEWPEFWCCPQYKFKETPLPCAAKCWDCSWVALGSPAALEVVVFTLEQSGIGREKRSPASHLDKSCFCQKSRVSQPQENVTQFTRESKIFTIRILCLSNTNWCIETFSRRGKASAGSSGEQSPRGLFCAAIIAVHKRATQSKLDKGSRGVQMDSHLAGTKEEFRGQAPPCPRSAAPPRRPSAHPSLCPPESLTSLPPQGRLRVWRATLPATCAATKAPSQQAARRLLSLTSPPLPWGHCVPKGTWTSRPSVPPNVAF